MNRDTLLLDSNTIMYLINGDETVLKLVDQVPVAISFVTEIELLGWPKMTKQLEAIIKDVLVNVQYLDYSFTIRQKTIQLKQSYNLKLADSFIAATALEFNLPLISADKGFTKVSELQLISFVPSL